MARPHAASDAAHVLRVADGTQHRAESEARTEGEQLLKTTERFLHKNADELSQEELLQTAAAMQALQLAVTMEDKDLLHKKIEELNDISRPYAERVMDMAVSRAMKGKQA